jgi:sugar phosphate permease
VELQTALGYSPIGAGAATLPMTALMLAFAARGGALAQRIGPRIPLTIGPLLIAAGMLLMRRIHPGSSYVADVLPAVLVFGCGLVFVVAPVTATVLAAAPARHAGLASGVNNAVARTAGLIAVAVLPLAAGLTAEAYLHPVALTNAFHTAMTITAVVAASGGVIAWLTIRSDVLDRGRPAAREYRCCPVDGPPVVDAAAPALVAGESTPVGSVG